MSVGIPHQPVHESGSSSNSYRLACPDASDGNFRYAVQRGQHGRTVSSRLALSVKWSIHNPCKRK